MNNMDKNTICSLILDGYLFKIQPYKMPFMGIKLTLSKSGYSEHYYFDDMQIEDTEYFKILVDDTIKYLKQRIKISISESIKR